MSKRKTPSAQDEYFEHLPWRARLSYWRYFRFLFVQDEYVTRRGLS